MPTVFFIEGKVRQCLERSSFSRSRYDKVKVVDDEFLVCMQYTVASSLVVAPQGEKFGV